MSAPLPFNLIWNDDNPMPNTSRRSAISAIAGRSAVIKAANNGASPSNGVAINSSVAEYFGINTFGARQMRSKLPKDVFSKLTDAIRHGKKLDLEVAPTVAQSIKEWAISKG